MLKTVRYGRRGRGSDMTDVLEGLRVLHVVWHQTVLLWWGV